VNKTYILLYLLLFLIPLTFSVHEVLGDSTVVCVDPASLTAAVGQTFSVNINVTNIAAPYNFTCWQLNLYYLNGILNCTSATEGPFLKSGGSPYGTSFSSTINNNYNSTYGQLSALCYIYGNSSYAVVGSGVIMTVTFRAVGGGNTALTLSDIVLGDGEIPSEEIPYTVTNGTVSVTGATYGIAVTNVTSAKKVIFRGYTGNITVTVENIGNSVETLTTTLFINSTQIQNQTINNMPSGTLTNLTFVWNTSGFAKGIYSISATATNSSMTGGWVYVSMVGDLTGTTLFVPDGKCDGRDITVVAGCFGTAVGDQLYNVNCDIFNRGKIDGRDITIVAGCFGNVDP
jgi:hypothetical protein